MVSVIVWYLAVSFLGLLTFPLAFRLFPVLPDKGYTISRVLGLLLWGYIYWLFGSLGILRNDYGGLLFALLMLAAASVAMTRLTGLGEIQDWWRTHVRLVAGTELLFLGAFVFWVIVRASNPGIFGTEKPMELAFINAISRSESFPPHDPWLSGYAISYYYFGYILVAMLGMLWNVPAGVVFNLAISMVFSLSALGAYGLVFNLLTARPTRKMMLGPSEKALAAKTPAGAVVEPQEEEGTTWLAAFLGPVFVLVLGNLEGLLEVMHARGLFWRIDGAGNLTSRFWQWLDLRELTQPPAMPFSWLPRNFSTGYWWWWRASRVVQDYDLAGQWREVIDEFPFFSFLLSDLHPHVLAIPFAFLAMALALNLYLAYDSGQLMVYRWRLDLSLPTLMAAALILGGLAFLNTWDFPIYLGLFTGVYVIKQVHLAGWGWARLREFIGVGFVIGGLGVTLYLPFYIGFSSQAGGILPNLVYPTRGAHLWVMFGLFFVLFGAYFIHLGRQATSLRHLRKGFWLSLVTILALWILAFVLALVIILIPIIGDIYLDSIGARGLQDELFREAIVRRFTHPGGWLTLFVLLTFTFGFLLKRLKHDPDETGGPRERPVQTFVLWMILVGLLLVLGPEFFFLRDQFGWRINTIFKFYYQTWLLWGVAGAFCTVVLLRELRRGPAIVFRVVLLVFLSAGLVYPTLSLWDKTQGFQPLQGLNLDGAVGSGYLGAEDAEAVEWLRSAPLGVVVEAVGGSYSAAGRISAHSGLPTVLGWPGHESQWRGGATEIGSRQEDIARLYSTRSWDEAQTILTRYGIRYVYLGDLERSTYGVDEGKFQRRLNQVYQKGPVTIYEVPVGVQ